VVIQAPPGAIERRFVLAHALRALIAGGVLVALAPKRLGGSRLAAELRGFGCEVGEQARAHHRICRSARPARPTMLREAIAEGALQFLPALGLWTQPGVFSWNRIDPGAALLLAQPWAPSGSGADFGCGLGVLAQPVLASPSVTTLSLFDIDARAIAAARLNLADTRVSFLQHDLRQIPSGLAGLDFVVMNPPFHDGGVEDRALGQAFIETSAEVLRPGAVLRLVANLGLPYEAILGRCFTAHVRLAQANGYKVLEARR
jgi:16S rRNA (guanine1207-N2)-methyltransferase